MPGVPRAMDHHSSGCLSAEKFPTFASCWQGGEQQRFQLHDVVQEESLAYGDGLAHWTSEALDAIGEAEALGEKSGARYWFAELHRLRSVFLTAIGAEESKIEASFRRSHKNRKGAEVGLPRETRRSDLRGIPSPKSDRIGRTWVATTSLLTSCSPIDNCRYWLAGSPTEYGSSTTTKRSEGLFKRFWRQSCESFGTFAGI
jgi:hypothetical protein